jgi:murein DD-endopeptidase MepM/ murein hydrolase activator NlpD
LARRVRSLYKRDPRFSWEFLLGARGLDQLFRRYRYLQIAAERDATLVQEVETRVRRIAQERAELTEALSEVAMLRQEKERAQAQLERSRRERLAMLRKIRREKKQHRQAIRELEASEKKLRALLEKLERKRLKARREAGRFARQRGWLIWPVDGEVAKPFGKSRHPVFGTVTFNSGIDIRAPLGAPVRAVFEGTVEFVDWIAGYGRCIIVDHGSGYYTLYAHVGETFVAPGQKVQTGEVIAEVGESGSLVGAGCHFEIRRSKQALNPLEWLRRR